MLSCGAYIGAIGQRQATGRMSHAVKTTANYDNFIHLNPI
jgi:hypothetical protein